MPRRMYLMPPPWRCPFCRYNVTTRQPEPAQHFGSAWDEAGHTKHAEQAGHTLAEMDAKRCCVLVVEDDAALRAMLVQFFQDEGYEVRAAKHGRLALHAIAQWSPDVIVLDRHMPSMDGEEFACVYRALPPPHAPIVLLTGDVHPEAAGERVGAEAVVVKPFDLDDLLAAVTWVAQERALAPT